MKKKAAKPPTASHGGIRHGAGRKAALGRKEKISVTLTPDVLAFMESHLSADPPRINGPLSRSEFIDAAVRSTDAFKIWLREQI